MLAFLTILSNAYFIFQSKSAVICTSGDCNINCNSVKCNTVICTSKASSCTINCQDGQCQQSKFYLAAYNHNTVNCDRNDLCNELSIQCGAYELPPSGYTEHDFNGPIHECSLQLLNNAIPTNVYMQCHHNVAICQCNGDGCDQIIKLFDTESGINDNKNLSQVSSDKSDSEFVYILLFIFIGMMLMTFAICCCIRILYEYRRKMIAIQLDVVDIDRQQSQTSHGSESEQILENADVKRSQQPHIIYSSVNSMLTVPPIPRKQIVSRDNNMKNKDKINLCHTDSTHSSSSILDEQQ